MAEFRVTPAGNPVLRFVIEAGQVGERFKLGVVMTGAEAELAKGRAVSGRSVTVAGRLRAVGKGGVSVIGGRTLEILAKSVEFADS